MWHMQIGDDGRDTFLLQKQPGVQPAANVLDADTGKRKEGDL